MSAASGRTGNRLTFLAPGHDGGPLSSRDLPGSIKEVSKPYGVSPKSIWRCIREGRFPKPVKLAPKIARWREADLRACEEDLDK